MTSICFSSGELLDIISALEVKEDKAYMDGDDYLAAYYMQLAAKFECIYDKLQDLPGEQRESTMIPASNFTFNSN